MIVSELGNNRLKYDCLDGSIYVLEYEEIDINLMDTSYLEKLGMSKEEGVEFLKRYYEDMVVIKELLLYKGCVLEDGYAAEGGVNWYIRPYWCGIQRCAADLFRL